MTINISQDNYPETLGKMYIINAGMLFSAVWTIVKPFLDPVTQSKIVIISGSGKKELKKEIDEYYLPEFLGGKFNNNINENHGCYKEAIDVS